MSTWRNMVWPLKRPRMWCDRHDRRTRGAKATVSTVFADERELAITYR